MQTRTRSSRFQAVISTGNVMKAVILRDMRTRFFNHGLGFLVVPLWPLVHLLILLGLYRTLGRTAPYGLGLYMFFATGLIPTLTFMYVSRFMALSILLNKPMMAFPVVKPIDIMAGRAVLETMAAFLTVGMATIFLFAVGSDPVPFDPVEAMSAFLATLLLAVGVGSIVGVLVMTTNLIITIYSLSLVVIYLLSGTLFVVTNLPSPIVRVLSWNPVLHCVEWMRIAYFPGYPSQVLDRGYLLGFGLCSLFLGMAFERLMRRRLFE